MAFACQDCEIDGRVIGDLAEVGSELVIEVLR